GRGGPFLGDPVSRTDSSPRIPAGRRPRRRRLLLLSPSRKIALLLIGWAAAALMSLRLGAVPIPAGDVLGILLYPLPFIGDALGVPWWNSAHEVIVFQIRLPRLLLAGMVGGSL